MSIVSEIFEHNRQFIERREYEAFLTDQFPNKRLVVLTCMDTRLVELLPRAMGFRNGDVKLVKNAGAIVSHPFGSVMRSIMLAIYELMAEEVIVVGHTGCGMTGLSCERVLDKALKRGVCLRYSVVLDEHPLLVGYGVVPPANVHVTAANVVLRVDTSKLPNFVQVVGQGGLIVINWRALAVVGKTGSMQRAKAQGVIGGYPLPRSGVIATMLIQ